MFMSCHSERSRRNLLLAGRTQLPEGPNSIAMRGNYLGPISQSHSSFSLTRAFTIFFTSASGKGLSEGN